MKKIFALILVLAIGICLCPAPLYYNYYTTNANPVTGGQATNVFVGSSGGVATVTTNVAGSIYVVNVTTSSVAAITKVPSTRYVSMTGNDTTAVAGNPAQAWSTISNAVRVSSYSDIVHVFPGNYTGQVNAVNGVVVNYELGANHYTPAAQYLYDASGAGITNVQISGLGNLIGSPTTGTTMFNVSNSLCDIFIECNQFASQEIGNADHVLALGSFKSIKIKPRLGKLLSLPSYNTSDSSTFEWWGAPFLAFYQHIDLAGTNRFFNANVNWREWDENNVGKLEFFGGQLNDSPNVGYLNGGIVTLFGSRVLAPTGSKLLDATAYTNYPFATNIHGFWQSVQDDTFVAANNARIENQGSEASLYMVSRSGSGTLATNRIYYDGTNNRVSFQRPIYGDGSGLTNVPNSATTITNVTTTAAGVLIGGSGSYGIGSQNFWYKVDANNWTNTFSGGWSSAGVVSANSFTGSGASLTSLPQKASQTGTHSSPSTSNPLSPTWASYDSHTVWYGATGTINLPAASTYANKDIIIYNTGAFTITIDANGSEVIVRDGTVQTGGVSITLSSGAGNYVALICDGVRWVTVGYKGTLSQGS